jgi:hypothetical protein
VTRIGGVGRSEERPRIDDQRSSVAAKILGQPLIDIGGAATIGRRSQGDETQLLPGFAVVTDGQRCNELGDDLAVNRRRAASARSRASTPSGGSSVTSVPPVHAHAASRPARALAAKAPVP